MSEAPEITVCVPVDNSAPLIGEALASIAVQTHPGFRVLVSVDPSPDGSLEVCRQWERDPRFRIIAQPSRLGWPGNVNWLLDRVTTPRLCVVLPDDRVEPDYLARLAAALDHAPAAVLAYGEVAGNGLPAGFASESLTGSPCERVCAFLLVHWSGTPWRGVIRTEAALATDLLDSRRDGFAADVQWLVALAAAGEFLRVPGAIHHERIRDDGITTDWRRLPSPLVDARWMDHAAACLGTALDSRNWEAEERQAIAAAAAVRALSIPDYPPPFTTAELFQRLGDFALRAAALAPDLFPPPTSGAIPADFAAIAEVRIGRLVRR